MTVATTLCLFCGGDPTDPGHPARCDGRQGHVDADGDDLAGMIHRGDPFTSVDAAAVVARGRTELHGRIVAAFRAFGPMTDEALEQLDEFARYGPSTIRKRRSELYQQGVLQACGATTNSRGRKMLIWTV